MRSFDHLLRLIVVKKNRWLPLLFIRPGYKPLARTVTGWKIETRCRLVLQSSAEVFRLSSGSSSRHNNANNNRNQNASNKAWRHNSVNPVDGAIAAEVTFLVTTSGKENVRVKQFFTFVIALTLPGRGANDYWPNELRAKKARASRASFMKLLVQG